MKQIHKRFSSEQVKELLERYEKRAISRKAIEEVLGIKKVRLFRILKRYREDKNKFAIGYERRSSNNKISEEAEKRIREELERERSWIKDKDIPVYWNNYSEIKRELETKGKIKISVPTIINRAKEWGYYQKKQKRSKHDREVISNYTGELIQHDSSHHLFAPLSREKYYLITSLDDYSRYILYAKLFKRESTAAHIKALEKVFSKHGFPLNYYVDNHSIFRFVGGRDDTMERRYDKTDEYDTQWQQVLRECRVGKINALSPQAKGKVERSYRWLQDHLVRQCMRNEVRTIEQAQEILDEEIRVYNYKRRHSTTQEVPAYRFKSAIKDNNLWRRFEIPKPYISIKDIFCMRETRVADGYRAISLNTLKIRINKINPYDEVDIRIYVLNEQISELRFWRGNQLLDIQKFQNKHLDVYF